MTVLKAILGDITTQDVDAIVNASDHRMHDDGGVGATYQVAGPGSLEECKIHFPDGKDSGNAGWTSGYNLPARFVIHTSVPSYQAGQTDRTLLESVYRGCLALADKLGVESIAFPLIGPGLYGWPVEDALNVAVEVLSTNASNVKEIRIVTQDQFNHSKLERQLGRLTWLRLLQGVAVLHQRGFEGVRIYPGMRPTGLNWQLLITSQEYFKPREHFKPRYSSENEFVPDWEAPALRYNTVAGARVGNGYVTTATTPDEAADIILQELPLLAKKFDDREYVVWFEGLLAVVTGLKRVPIAHAEYFEEDGKVKIGGDILFPAPPIPPHLRN
ncbi:hypothetical protein GC425_02990 [Corynebacterium sp. zg254]|uniref:Macro domain-containing protein n=1 Tax=Corynebacterium zhongnanshanii TaxID=2768834 RepID=A0ABQ6VFJ3_9CORY|nr:MULTISPECIES: macro domain-containing protein [Corynebacterium]KAB3523073.1 hypothetical protein F8377_02630 [Corynebacterium zhongnanshanii]MCR5913833.1 hypothetical protein [Corynebacterium sp. zg254]